MSVDNGENADMKAAQRLQTLFDRALQLDAAARTRWLEDLRARALVDAEAVERLLARDSDGADPFGGAIDAMRRNLEMDDAEWIGSEIGGFRILRLLGSGGMGSVFLAERQMRDFQQLVALKLLRGMWLDDTTLKRFASERRILARLHHPYIATLIDAASHDGRPFLAMEYVEGVALGTYCDEARLDLGARIRLARMLLGALAYAHRQLVVHRDLKPSNVLVTSDGTPKLLDFGIARLLDPETEQDSTATRSMTPAYASPEQLAGEPAGTGSDIYSFGLILYELCVGVLPWEPGARPGNTDTLPTSPSSRFRRLDSVRRSELAARRDTTASRIRRKLHGDLGRILARCLEPDPARRYASADALDIDLGALLSSRPPPGVQVPLVGRTLAFARRHAWPLAVAAVLLVAGAGLLLQSLRATQRLQVERDRAVAAAEAARVEAAKSDQIAHFAQTMLAGIDPNRAEGMDRSLLRLMLDGAAQRARTELAGQPEVRVAIERTIAESYYAIGEYQLAVQHDDEALAGAKKLADSTTTQVAIHNHKSRALSSGGELEQAMQEARAAVATAAELPETSAVRMFAEGTLAGVECEMGEFQACRDRYAKVYPRQVQALGANDGQTLGSAMGLATAEDFLGHAGTAQTLYRSVIAARRAESDQPTSYLLAAINALGVSYLREQRFVEAEALLKPALADAEALFGADHPVTLTTRSNLGGAIRQQPGRNAEARPYYERTLEANKKLYGKDSRQTTIAEINLALLLRDANELDAALVHAQAAVNSGRRLFPADSPMLAVLIDYYASVLVRRGDYAAAKRRLDEAWHILTTANGLGPAHPRIQEAAGFHVELYEAQHMPKQAAKWRKRAGEAPASK